MKNMLNFIKKILAEKSEKINTINKIIIHHSVEDGGIDSVDKYHKGKWNFRSKLGFYVGYHYYISRDGRIYHCRADEERGAHTVGQNNELGVCLMGNGEVDGFTQEQYKALEYLLNYKMKEYNVKWQHVYGHRDFSVTACPSQRLYDWLQWKRNVL